MPTVKCPHCGAGNQDASDTDRCWQCETVLGNPTTLVAMPTNPIVAATRQLDPNMAPTVPTRSNAASQRTYTLMLLVSVLAFAIVLVIVLLLWTRQ